jgi:hypothetical protein
MRPRFHRRGLRVSRERTDESAVQRTEALLRRLPPREWSVLPRVNSRSGVDHVLVGPGGVFAITSHAPPTAAARVREGVLWLRHGHDPRADRPGVAINRHALDAARALHREIRTRTGRGPEVHPVVVLWCEFPQRIAESSRITFVHGRDLPAWVVHRPAELDGPGRGEIVQALLATGSSQEPEARPVPHLPRPRIPHPSRSRRRAA